MAKLRMTYKNLKALRKTREYQALLVDLVANNIVPKSVAENLLGYNIPANLIGGAESGNEEGPTVTEPEAATPTITTDLPATKTINGSDTLEIAASVTDEGTLSYAWTKDGNPIADATTDTLTVTEAGTYQCTVTNTLGEDTATAQSTACVVTAAAEEGNTVTLLYFDATANDGAGEWKTATYTLTGEDSAADFIAAAQRAFGDFAPNGLNQCTIVVENQAYNPDGMSLDSLYVALDPQPEALVKDQLIKVYYEAVAPKG